MVGTGVISDVRRSTAVLLSCLPLAGLAAWIASLGVDRLWLTETGDAPLPFVAAAVAAALHAAWILPAFHRDSPALIGLAWLASVWACRAGLVAAGFDDAVLPATLLETITLAIALNACDGSPWAERLARWRRARQNIATQLRMGDGLAPWVAASTRQLLTGKPDRPAVGGFDRVAADLADAEQRLHARLAAVALPEAVRQSMLAAAQALVSRAEAATAHVAITLERQALEEAAACRDRIAALTGISDAEREALATQCEALMLDLVSVSGKPRQRAMALGTFERTA